MISDDEDNHLAYCHEELLRLARAGHGRTIQRILRECALAEIRVYRDVSLAVMDHMGRLLGWPRAQVRRAGRRHPRHVRVRAAGRLARAWSACEMPERRDALGGRAVPDPSTRDPVRARVTVSGHA